MCVFHSREDPEPCRAVSFSLHAFVFSGQVCYRLYKTQAPPSSTCSVFVHSSFFTTGPNATNQVRFRLTCGTGGRFNFVRRPVCVCEFLNRTTEYH